MTKADTSQINIQKQRITFWRNSYPIPSPGPVGLSLYDKPSCCSLRFESIEVFDEKNERNAISWGTELENGIY